MCGLVGVYFPRGTRPESLDLAAAVAAIAHRGPDDRRFYVSADRRFQAGFARLAIIDLDTGAQPIVEGDGRRVLMGNGEIYNYVELRRDLPYAYATQGDVEVVLPLADRYGAGFVHRLNGMYGLALYDRDPHRLTLVRDRLGIKPIYWMRLPDGAVAFASEIKALFRVRTTTPEIDQDAVSSYLAHGYVPSPATIYRGVHKLPPGHRLIASDDGSVAIERYWRPTAASDGPREPVELRDYLVALMRDAVRLQLRSDVPVGALLSGGIDSGMVVALAAAESPRPIRTYTVRFEGGAVDETPLAREVAGRYGSDHTEFDLAAADATAHLPRLAWFADEPLSDPSLLPNYLIESALSRSVKVALNGTGGDELFAGYGRYFQLPVERRYLSIPRLLRHGVVEPACAAVAPMTGWRLGRAEKYHDSRGDYLFEHSTLFPPPIRDLIGNRMAPPEPAQVRALADFMEARESDLGTAALAADLSTYLPENLLTLLDRTSMAVGVEGRVPLLDHRLVEAALAVPDNVRTPANLQKGLMRQIAADFLPRAVVSAPKQGFASPVSTWLARGLARPARAILTRPRTLERGWWSRAGIDALLAAPGRHAPRLYSLLMLELVVRVHVEGSGGACPPREGLEAFAEAS
jgi:asparagine synthase (glutamine-hydrolysing)